MKNFLTYGFLVFMIFAYFITLSIIDFIFPFSENTIIRSLPRYSKAESWNVDTSLAFLVNRRDVNIFFYAPDPKKAIVEYSSLLEKEGWKKIPLENYYSNSSDYNNVIQLEKPFGLRNWKITLEIQSWFNNIIDLSVD